MVCPKNGLVLQINPEFESLGDSYYTPERMKAISFEAETGRVPVSGTGYKGLFAGKGFDGIWFDFSEIVRPTRDGIHGREYISTSVDLGRKVSYLRWNNSGTLDMQIPRVIEIPIPIIFDAPCPLAHDAKLSRVLVKAASKLKTFVILDANEYSDDLLVYSSHIIPRFPEEKINTYAHLIRQSKIVEIEILKTDDIAEILRQIKTYNQGVLVSVHVPYNENAVEQALMLTSSGVDILHFYLPEDECIQDPDRIVTSIRTVHTALVQAGIRDEVTFISAGGIAEAAQVPKSIILGADATVVGHAYHIALGCRSCDRKSKSPNCFPHINEISEIASQRIVNLIGAWRDQLLEVLGGMGLREVRRQRGEQGRTLFYSELEEKIFGENE
ncbi:MAG TPA: glutamate synthase-related protein [Candidatus Thermoplasmatota archaeon]|nr:glutamate synthase-related protein [Candidatus Thermoplasmatota archaeon]